MTVVMLSFPQNTWPRIVFSEAFLATKWRSVKQTNKQTNKHVGNSKCMITHRHTQTGNHSHTHIHTHTQQSSKHTNKYSYRLRCTYTTNKQTSKQTNKHTNKCILSETQTHVNVNTHILTESANKTQN